MSLSHRVWHLTNLALVLLGLLGGRLAYWHLLRAPELQPVVLDPVLAAAQYAEAADEMAPLTLAALPQPVVQRTVARLRDVQRGAIYDRNSQPLAYSEIDTEGRPVRRYTVPSLAHVVGYVSGLGTGVTGIEHSLNPSLLGLDRWDSQLSQAAHQPIVGSDVYLTIDARVQEAAAQALGGRAGAVVVLDARSGAILAMVSAPGFDPNRILEPEYAAGLLQGCEAEAGCQGALLNRAAQGLYAPGSTWKTVTLIAALDTGQVTRETVFDFGAPIQGPNGPYYVYRVDGGVIEDHTHREAQLDLAEAYAASANAAFARLGDELGGEALRRYAARLGFSTPRGAPPIEIGASAAQVANDPAELQANNLLRAATAIGQGELLASPLSMALAMAAVVNEGDVPRPHLLQAVRHPSGRVLAGEPRGDWLPNAMRPRTAQTVRDLMEYAVRHGSGGQAAVPGLTVGGKTGTAQLGGALAPHAWFAGFAADDEHALAIAVVVEHGGSGAQVAAPIFAQTAEAAMRYLNEPVTASARP